MKSFSKIFILLFLFVALFGCEQKPITQGGENTGGEEDIFIPSDSYIYFNVDPLTRGELIPSGAFLGDFNVLGYNYQGRWEAAVTTASQTTPIKDNVPMGVFYSSNILAKKGVQLVTYNETGKKHEYTYEGSDKSDVGNQKEWDGALRYSFFAWHPTSLVVNGGNVNYFGEPYISYSIASETPADESKTRADESKTRAEMVDVITACKIDVTKFNGSSVNFNMEHRLAALDILANSIITMKSLKEAHPEINFANEGISDNARITVENITALTLKLDKIKKNVSIPLNTSGTTVPLTAEGELTDVIYNDFDCTGISIPYYSTADDMKTLMGDNKLILIPQTEDIEASLVISYDVVCTDGGNEYRIHYDRGNLETNKLETTIKGLQEKHYHYLELTFTASGVFLQARVDESWIPLRVDYEFE